MRGHTAKKGKHWYVVIDIERDPLTNKRKQKWFSGYSTKKEAEKALPEILSKVQNGQYFDNKKKTIESLLEDWFSIYVKENTSYNTRKMYNYIIKKYIIPSLGKMEIDKVKPLHIQKYYSSLQEKGLAAASIKKHHTVLNSAFKQAIKWQLTSNNPILGVVSPKVETPSMNIWEQETITVFLDLVKDTKFYVPYLLAFTTGMRQGELAALRWADFEPDNGIIRVRYSMIETGELKEPKTKGSKRTIKLMDPVLLALKEHKKKQLEYRLLLGEEYMDLGFICARENGKPLGISVLGKTFRRLVIKNNLPYIRFHDIRHTFATIMLKENINPKIVSELLGHNNVMTTLSVYSHVLPSMQEEAIKKAQRNFF